MVPLFSSGGNSTLFREAVMRATCFLFCVGVLCTPSVAVCHPIGKINSAIPNTGSWSRVACTAASAWKLPNGKVVYPGSPWLERGWISSSWVGASRAEDLSRFDQEAVRDLGFTTGFWAHNSCPPNQHCIINSDLIRAHSTELSVQTCD
jgi:hypothetical protein